MVLDFRGQAGIFFIGDDQVYDAENRMFLFEDPQQVADGGYPKYYYIKRQH